MAARSILLVSADSDSTLALHDRFGKAGYKMSFTQNIDEALAIARHELPQAIILDSEVPALDLIGLTEELRSSLRTRHIHLTLLVSRAERDSRLIALRSGVDEFMTKPIDVEELELRVRNALRRAEFQNLVNPTSGLPGPLLIEERLRELLHAEPGWALLRLSMHNYTVFSDVYGFLAGEEVLRFAGRLFSEVMNRHSASDDFLGHSGDDQFVIITSDAMVADLRNDLRARFDEEIKSHYSFRERERGYMSLRNQDGTETRVALMSLVVRTTSSQDGPFSDIRELAAF